MERQTRHTDTCRARSRLAGAVGLVAASLLVGNIRAPDATVSATGNPPAPPPPGCVDVGAGGEVVYECASEGGFLRLHLGASDYFRYEPDTDADGVVDTEQGGPGAPTTQPISTVGCAASLGAPELVTMTPGPAGATLGQKKDSIGVRFAEGGGEPCSQVNGTGVNGQSLALALGSAPEVEGKLIDWAEIDVERKFDGVMRADFYEGGPAGVLTGSILAGCTAGLSDCGPDSADGDNFRLDTKNPPDGQAPPDPFDTIVMTLDASGPANGAFSLEGGADGTVPGPVGATLTVDPHDSIFHLLAFETVTYEGSLDCGDVVSTEVPSGGTATSSTVERLDNKATACEQVPYDLSGDYDPGADEQVVVFDVELHGQPDAAFEWVISWDAELPVYPLVGSSEFDFDDGNGRSPARWCGGTYDSSGVTATERMADVVPIDGVGGCLVHQEQVLDSGLVRVTEILLVTRDPFGWR